MAKLRVGIVGVGRHGSRYARHAAGDVEGLEEAGGPGIDVAVPVDLHIEQLDKRQRAAGAFDAGADDQEFVGLVEAALTAANGAVTEGGVSALVVVLTCPVAIVYCIRLPDLNLQL